MNIQDQPILILGTGAMACLFAARLAAAGVRVKMLGSWPEGLRALWSDGVRILDEDGVEQVFPVEVADKTSQCKNTRYALVLVKSWQTPRAAQQLAECLVPNGLALTLQNGLDNRQILADALGERRVALGVTTLGATLLGPGSVRVGGNGQISLGSHFRIEPFAELLRTSGFQVEIIEDTNSLIWGKLVINAAINPVTALLRVANGELLTRPAARNLMQAAAREAAQVAGRLGVTLPYADPVLAVEVVAGRTANNFSSMLRDIQRGAPTEIDSINAAIVRAGERVGVPTPVNQTLWYLIKAIEFSADAKAQTITPDIPAGRKVKKIRQPLSRKSAYLASLK